MVPGQDPNHILLSVKKHLEKHGFNDIEVQMINGQKAYRSNYNHPFIDHVLESAKEVYENDVILSPNAAGTGPMYIFGEHLMLPIVSTGVGWVGSKAHAPNESIRIKDFEDGIVHIAYMLNGFSSALETKVESTEVNH